MPIYHLCPVRPFSEIDIQLAPSVVPEEDSYEKPEDCPLAIDEREVEDAVQAPVATSEQIAPVVASLMAMDGKTQGLPEVRQFSNVGNLAPSD